MDGPIRLQCWLRPVPVTGSSQTQRPFLATEWDFRIYCDALAGTIFSRMLSRDLSPRESNSTCSHSHLPSASTIQTCGMPTFSRSLSIQLEASRTGNVYPCCRKNGATSPISRSMLKESAWTSAYLSFHQKSSDSWPLRCCKASIVASRRHLVD